MSYNSFYLFDWLSFTRRDFSVQETQELLGLESVPWQNLNGFYGYQDRKYYECISIHYNGKESGIWCEMSGQGCRAFTDFGAGDFYTLLKVLTQDGMTNITRIDLAFDDHDGLLDIKRLCSDTINENFISRFGCFSTEHSKNTRTGITGRSVYHGRKGSKIMLRIYDKAAERGITDKHWVRVEVQLRDKRAIEFVKLYLENGTSEIGRVFQGVVNNYIRYVKPDKNDSNKSRWKNAAYWDRFIKTAEKITLFKQPGVDYNIELMKNFVVNQAGNPIAAMLEIYGLEYFEHLIKSRDIRENPKYKQIVEQWQNRKPKGKPDLIPADISGIPEGAMLDLSTGELIEEGCQEIINMFGGA